MERIRNRRNRVVFVLAVAAVLWMSSHRAIDGFAPGASAQLANRAVEQMLPLTSISGDANLDGRIRGRITVDEASLIEGDWNGDGFDILSFRHGLARSADGGGLVLEDMAIMKDVDKSTPKLAQAVARGRVFPKFEIEFTSTFGDAGSLPYLRYELSNVRVTNHQIMGGYGEDAIQSRFWGSETVNELAESVHVNFEEIKVTYTEYDESGSPRGDTEFNWKVEKGEP